MSVYAAVAALLLAVIPISAAPRDSPAPMVGDSPAVADKDAPPAWLSRVNVGPAGNFPAPRSFQASYRATWADVEAARIEARCTLPEGGSEIQTVIKAETTGAARLLWKMDANATCTADRHTLRPLHYDQTLELPKRQSHVRVDFSSTEAVRTVLTPPKPDDDPARFKPRHFRYPGLFDMHSAMLYLRSLPLTSGTERTLPVMAANTPYLVTIHVLDRERVKVLAGEFPALVCSLELEKINKHGELEPHKSFKSARAWISDDANRMLLKIETEVFVGSVNLELEKVAFN